MDRQAVHEDMERARTAFHQLLDGATDAEVRRPSNGTRWTNRQLLFHMLLGYLILRALLMLVRVFNQLPTGVNRSYAQLLNKATKQFDAVNYFGSRLGGTFLTRRQMLSLFDHVITKLHRRLDAETDTGLGDGMHYPTRWDPFFKDYMTRADIYRFPTEHFDSHRRQLTLSRDPDAD